MKSAVVKATLRGQGSRAGAVRQEGRREVSAKGRKESRNMLQTVKGVWRRCRMPRTSSEHSQAAAHGPMEYMPDTGSIMGRLPSCGAEGRKSRAVSGWVSGRQGGVAIVQCSPGGGRASQAGSQGGWEGLPRALLALLAPR